MPVAVTALAPPRPISCPFWSFCRDYLVRVGSFVLYKQTGGDWPLITETGEQYEEAL